MSSVRKLLEKKEPSFGDINRVFNSHICNYTKEEALQFINSEKVLPYLKTVPILNVFCNNQDFGHELISALVQRGADLNFQTWQGMTALHCAAAYGNLKAVSTLLILGANSLLPDESGLFPLNHAVFTPTDNIDNDKQMLHILVAQGGNDPSYVYHANRSAMSDCINQELRTVLQTADQQRLKLARDQDNQLNRILAKHIKHAEQRKKDNLIESLKTKSTILSRESKGMVEGDVTIFYSNKLLELNIKENIQLGVLSEVASFGMIKVANRNFELLGTYIAELDEMVFSIHDLETGEEILDRIFLKDLHWTFQQLEGFMLQLKKSHDLPKIEPRSPLFFVPEDKQQMKKIEKTDLDKVALCLSQRVR